MVSWAVDGVPPARLRASTEESSRVESRSSSAEPAAPIFSRLLPDESQAKNTNNVIAKMIRQIGFRILYPTRIKVPNQVLMRVSVPRLLFGQVHTE